MYGENRMIVISVKFKVEPNKIQQAKAAFVFRQNRSTAEDGCISFRFYQDLEDPDTYFLFEEWKSQDALEAHWENQKKSSVPNAPEWPKILGESLAIRYEVSAHRKLQRD
jgi:quinol monooxygenase YgiN